MAPPQTPRTFRTLIDVDVPITFSHVWGDVCGAQCNRCGVVVQNAHEMLEHVCVIPAGEMIEGERPDTTLTIIPLPPESKKG